MTNCGQGTRCTKVRKSASTKKRVLTEMPIFAVLVKEFSHCDRKQAQCKCHKGSLQESNLHSASLVFKIPIIFTKYKFFNIHVP